MTAIKVFQKIVNGQVVFATVDIRETSRSIGISEAKAGWDVWKITEDPMTRCRLLRDIPSEEEAEKYAVLLAERNDFNYRRSLQVEIDRPVEVIDGMRVVSTGLNWAVSKDKALIYKGLPSEEIALKQRRYLSR